MGSPPVPEATSDDEDDYMNMTFEDTASSQKNETLTQRKKRLAREAEIKGRPKSKAELAQEERKKRDSALSTTTLDTSNKGFKMMAALGYKPGNALGASRPTTDGGKDDRLLEPIGLEMRDSRSGIGADAEKKRKFREEVEAQQEADKKRKVEAGEFRERQQKEREEKKMEGQIWAAMKVCERLDEEDEAEQSADTAEPRRSKPLKSVDVLWRTLVKQRAINERDRRMRYDLHQSLSRRPDYIDPDEEKEDQMAMGRKAEVEEVDVDLDEEDEELNEFEALEVPEKLAKLVAYLRERWNYCFWCKYRYPDEKMEGCPGTTEIDHD
ncbi:G-patch domain-containing protein [Cladophialophora immunda]|nr:G-patch domain-containing protein [Cladophialophora immunda]